MLRKEFAIFAKPFETAPIADLNHGCLLAPAGALLVFDRSQGCFLAAAADVRAIRRDLSRPAIAQTAGQDVLAMGLSQRKANGP